MFYNKVKQLGIEVVRCYKASIMHLNSEFPLVVLRLIGFIFVRVGKRIKRSVASSPAKYLKKSAFYTNLFYRQSCGLVTVFNLYEASTNLHII